MDRTGDPGVAGIVAVGDAFCHTDPAFAYGLSFALARRTIGRIGLLDRTAVFDHDDALHDRIEAILKRLAASSPPPPGPARPEMLARLTEGASSTEPRDWSPRSS